MPRNRFLNNPKRNPASAPLPISWTFDDGIFLPNDGIDIAYSP
jgi:hypothetical protein